MQCVSIKDFYQCNWENKEFQALVAYERTMIYNSVQFKLSDSTEFSVDASGNLSLKNWSVIPDPDFQENFDFESTDKIANAANSTLGAILDPNNIGRKVNIEFVNDISSNSTDYTQSNFNNDINTNIPSWYIPTSSNATINNLFESIQNLADDYAWAFNNPALVRNELISEILEWMESVLDLFDLSFTRGSPLVLDLDGNGIELASVTGTDAVYWDIDQDGFREASGWISGGDGLLAIDKNADGIINDNGELFGNDVNFANGFAALAAYDSSNDGQITAADAAFSSLLVWVEGANDNEKFAERPTARSGDERLAA